MTLRLTFVCLAAFSLSACGSTSDRYAFWKDDGAPQGGTQPHLGDIPSQPNVEKTKAEMESMRQRLAQDRQNAYLAAQGIMPVEDTMTTESPFYETEVTDEMAPAAAYELAPVQDTQPQNGTRVIGNVQYNYDVYEQPYVYGHSRVMTAQAMQAAQQPDYPATFSDGSVSVDWSALSTPSYASNDASYDITGSISGQPAVYFKHGSSRLGVNDKALIRNIAESARQRSTSVVVVGHASRRTGLANAAQSRAVNLRMSAKRATAVMQELVRQGVPVDSIRINAVGDTDARDEQQDRRVDILFNN